MLQKRVISERYFQLAKMYQVIMLYSIHFCTINYHTNFFNSFHVINAPYHSSAINYSFDRRLMNYFVKIETFEIKM